MRIEAEWRKIAVRLTDEFRGVFCLLRIAQRIGCRGVLGEEFEVFGVRERVEMN